MPAPPLPRQQHGYFRWSQCFRVGVAVTFPTVGASASQSSEEPEQPSPFPVFHSSGIGGFTSSVEPCFLDPPGRPPPSGASRLSTNSL
uniref:Solute carrier family 25 member 14 n=1 Tax=Rousettus aegyptiacus TaxID=9407 RepID=A0A7J8ELQ0_ROUAE|nr:solute carrier family 25 member 14 [Rousettus aegyptiacus]